VLSDVSPSISPLPEVFEDQQPRGGAWGGDVGLVLPPPLVPTDTGVCVCVCV
jgi:hypothetical protein